MMLQLVTDAVISKGYGGAPAFYSSEDGRMISFKIGCKVYGRIPKPSRCLSSKRRTNA